MRLSLSLLFLLLLFISHANTQESGSISGTAQDQSGDPLLYANILLYTNADSMFTKAALTDELGYFSFTKVKSDAYYIQISYLGLEEYKGEAFSLTPNEEKHLDAIVVANTTTDLTEVTVTAERNMIEVQPDKIVFNIENSINASGSDALELLSKSPGVTLDNEENMHLMGKSGVKIYINGRPSRLHGQDLANYLKTMRSDNIEAIEIITNPSAQYEAEGNAGIINIRIKKNQNFGTNGSLFANYKKGDQESSGGQISLNHRNSGFNIYGTTGIWDGANSSQEQINRIQYGNYFNSSAEEVSSWLSKEVLY